MKKIRFLVLFLFLCLACVQIPMLSVSNVEAATVKSGLKKENGKYYFYNKGKKVTNTWKTVKTKIDSKSVSYKYYFGSNGAAYAGTKSAPAVKKINGAYYAFDQKARAYCSTTQVINSFQCKFAADGMLTGVVKVSGNYYYYAGKKKAVNTFKNVPLVINGKSCKYKYYFGKNGAAYKGVNDPIYGPSPLVKKINGAYYGFNEKARVMTGTHVINSKFYVFGSDGKYNSSASTKLRKASAYEKDAATLRSLLGKPKKEIVYPESCYGPGKDVSLVYANFTVEIYRAPGGKEIVLRALSGQGA